MRKGLPRLFGGHGIVEAAPGGLANPSDGNARDGTAHHGQIQGGGAAANSAAVFPGRDVQPEMELGFNARSPDQRPAETLGPVAGRCRK
jgi:hypothetical protein